MIIDNPTPSQGIALERLEKAIEGRQRLFTLWYGGIRAGKSYGAVAMMIRHSMDRSNETYIIGGYTQRQVLSVIAPIFQQIAEKLELKCKVSRGNVNPRIEIGSNVFLIHGGGEAGKDSAVQGITASGLLLDEYPLLHPDFIAQCEARTSVVGALRVYTANKTSPYHWTTMHYYNRMKEGRIEGLLLDTQTDENQHLDASFITERLSEYDELHAGRFMHNEFMLSMPSIYDWQVDTLGRVSEVSHSVISAEGGAYRIIGAIDTEYGIRIETHSVTELQDMPDMKIADSVYLDASRPKLRNWLRSKGHSVRGFVPVYSRFRLERTQRAFLAGKIRIHPDRFEILRALDEYANAGFYTSNIIPSVEILADKVAQHGT